jgi:hypothetical protein
MKTVHRLAAIWPIVLLTPQTKNDLGMVRATLRSPAADVGATIDADRQSDRLAKEKP